MPIRDDLIEEFDAIRSTYEQERLEVNESTTAELQCSGKVLIELAELEEPLSLVGHCENGESRSVLLTALPTITLNFRIPLDYPDQAPEFALDSTWITRDIENQLFEELALICTENLGMPMLFFVCQAIMDRVSEIVRGMKELHIDNSPFQQLHNISMEDLLRLVQMEGDLAAQRIFDKQCHDCEVCFENKVGKDCTIFTPCKHVFCKECVSAYYMNRIERQIRQMDCLCDGCDSVATQAQVLAAIGRNEFERYETILLNRAIETMDDVMECARKTCRQPVFLDSVDGKMGRCGACGYVFCTICTRAYHALEPCKLKKEVFDKMSDALAQCSTDDDIDALLEEYQYNNMQHVVETVLSEQWVRDNSKRCPVCKIPIQKLDGCNKITCCFCNNCFCWLCGDPSKGYDHFKTPKSRCFQRLFD